jgi:hypothetical protein
MFWFVYSKTNSTLATVLARVWDASPSIFGRNMKGICHPGYTINCHPHTNSTDLHLSTSLILPLAPSGLAHAAREGESC